MASGVFYFVLHAQFRLFVLLSQAYAISVIATKMIKNCRLSPLSGLGSRRQGQVYHIKTCVTL